MNSDSQFEENGFDGQPAAEIRLKARAVSRGVAVGRAVCLYGSNRQFFRVELKPESIGPELKRLRSALTIAKKQLATLAGRKKGNDSGSGPGIFGSHLAIVEDPVLKLKIEEEIADRLVNAEWAIKTVADEYVSKYKAVEDEHLRDRYIDVEDVADRILAALGVRTEIKLPYGKDSIVAAQDLKPSTVVEFAADGPQAFITENGGWTSHSFILAREMKRPAVTGVRKLLRRVKTGDLVIVDGYNGEVILNPSPDMLDRFEKPSPFPVGDLATEIDRDMPTRSLDGRTIRICANADEPTAYERARLLGADGVGLFRSEFLLSSLRRLPSEPEQFQAYRKMADSAGNGGVNVRTFDIGSDRSLLPSSGREPNPALGLRGVRLGLSEKGILRTQLRALLRASHERTVNIVLPLVSGISELRAVREMLVRETEHLRSKGRECGDPKLGVMIEIPSAVLMVDELAEESDLLLLGTNDLIQYLLAADRDNQAVAAWYRTLHPAVIRAIRTVLRAARNAGKPAIVCGEMAGSPYYVPLLLGLGATELSMNPTSMQRVRRIVSGIAVEEAERMAVSVANARRVEDSEAIIYKHIRENWRHLFPKDFSFT